MAVLEMRRIDILEWLLLAIGLVVCGVTADYDDTRINQPTLRLPSLTQQLSVRCSTHVMRTVSCICLPNVFRTMLVSFPCRLGPCLDD